MKMIGSRPVLVVISLSLVGLLLASCSSTANDDQSQATPTPSQSSSSPDTETNDPTATPTPSKPAATKPPKIDNNPDESTASAAGRYLSYDEYQASSAEFKGSDVVLFFNADWCSTCKLARDNFQASLNQIPNDLTLVVVDFDTAVDVKKKYGVTFQHTFVHISDSGASLHKWSGSVSFTEIVEQIA